MPPACPSGGRDSRKHSRAAASPGKKSISSAGRKAGDTTGITRAPTCRAAARMLCSCFIVGAVLTHLLAAPASDLPLVANRCSLAAALPPPAAALICWAQAAEASPPHCRTCKARLRSQYQIASETCFAAGQSRPPCPQCCRVHTTAVAILHHTAAAAIQAHSPHGPPEPLQQTPPLLAARPLPHKGVELGPGQAQAAQVVQLDGINDPGEAQLTSLVAQQLRRPLLQQ